MKTHKVKVQISIGNDTISSFVEVSAIGSTTQKRVDAARKIADRLLLMLEVGK